MGREAGVVGGGGLAGRLGRMSLVDEIMGYNRAFVARGGYVSVETDRLPSKRLAVVTCMDTRLVELLPMAMNLRNGDAKMIKIAGAVVAHPYGSVMRSILVAVYDLGVEEVAVVGHHDCGMTGLSCERLVEKMRQRGISEQVLEGLEEGEMRRFLVGFESAEEGVRGSVGLIRGHPLLPRGVRVHGMLIDPRTGKLEVVGGE